MNLNNDILALKTTYLLLKYGLKINITLKYARITKKFKIRKYTQNKIYDLDLDSLQNEHYLYLTALFLKSFKKKKKNRQIPEVPKRPKPS